MHIWQTQKNLVQMFLIGAWATSADMNNRQIFGMGGD